ncbi:MAG: hypothetical protein ABIP55_11900 [Tepidisphaeraceae bacterium]
MTSKTTSTLLLLAILIGCATQPKQPIPRRGEVVAQGIGTLSFRAPGAGLVSVFDINSNSIIHSSAVREGSVVSVNPQAGNITVTDADRAGRQIVHAGVSKSNRYEMWFIASRGQLGYDTTTQPGAR